jgi:hypothetical protein
MKYRIEKAKYKDGAKSPWWTIVAYQNGKPVCEGDVQYSSFWTIFKIWLKVILFC